MAKISYRSMMLCKTLTDFKSENVCNCGGIDKDHAKDCPVKIKELKS